MPYDVEVDWLYCMPPAHYKYVIDGAWSDYETFYHHEGETYVGQGGLYDFSDTCTALSNVRGYVLSQTITFYVRSSESSDWAYAGTSTPALPVYLTFGAPIGPWGDATTPRACWYNVIRDACHWLEESGIDYPNTTQGKLNARKYLAEAAYLYSGEHYGNNTHCYVDPLDPDYILFDMFSFVTDDDDVDCQDMSSWWVKLCNSVGMNGQVQRICGPNDITDLYTKPIFLVGTQSTWVEKQWDFHQVGWYDNVFDPCIKVKDPSDVERIPTDDDIGGDYKRDLYDSSYGYWFIGDPSYPLSITEVE